MGKAITDSWIRKDTKGREVRTEPGGLTARKGPTGTVFWKRYMIDGTPRWVRIGAYERKTQDKNGLTLQRARAEAAAMGVQAEEAREGRALDPAAERRAEKAAARVERLVDPTVEEFAKLYIERYAKVHKKTWTKDQQVLNADVLPVIGGLKLTSIERAHVTALLDRKVDAGVPKQAGETLKIVRKMLNFAVDRGQIKASPAIGMKPPIKSPPRKRVLVSKDADEICGMFRALAASAMHPGMKLAVEFQLLTAQRPGAVRGARWSEIDRESNVWTVPAERMKRTKASPWADLPNVVPLSAQALAVLERARKLAGDSDFVFSGRDPRKPWSPEAIDHELHRETMLERLKEHGVARFNLHDLRRTATTIMTSNGVAPHIVDRVLGHVPQGVTAEVYDQYEYSPEKRAALDTLGVRVAAMKARLRIVAPAALG